MALPSQCVFTMYNPKCYPQLLVYSYPDSCNQSHILFLFAPADFALLSVSYTERAYKAKSDQYLLSNSEIT